MALAMKPQPFTDLFRRVPAALEKVWDADVIAAGDKDFNDRPGLHRENVFDGVDDDFGPYRIIVSREESRDYAEHGAPIVLHASVSFAGGPKPVGRKRLCADGLVQGLLNIPPDADPLHSRVTEGGVFHWIYAQRARVE